MIQSIYVSGKTPMTIHNFESRSAELIELVVPFSLFTMAICSISSPIIIETTTATLLFFYDQETKST